MRSISNDSAFKTGAKLRQQTENIRLGNQLLKVKGNVNNKAPESLSYKANQEAILKRIRAMEQETEKLRRELDEQTLY
jgi:ABC-type phosphate transport system auxiliary subunit